MSATLVLQNPVNPRARRGYVWLTVPISAGLFLLAGLGLLRPVPQLLYEIALSATGLFVLTLGAYGSWSTSRAAPGTIQLLRDRLIGMWEAQGSQGGPGRTVEIRFREITKLVGEAKMARGSRWFYSPAWFVYVPATPASEGRDDGVASGREFPPSPGSRERTLQVTQEVLNALHRSIQTWRRGLPAGRVPRIEVVPPDLFGSTWEDG